MFENELAQFDEIFAQADGEKLEQPTLPDGKHKGQVLSMILTKTKKDETPMILVQFLDDSTDWEINIPFFLTIKSIPFVKPNLTALGFPMIGKFSETLLAFCEGFKAPKHVVLEKKTNRKNGNEYVNYTFYRDTDSDNDSDNVLF